MVANSKLCSTCTDILQLKDGQKSTILTEDNNTYHDHHTTFESLCEAVRQDCFICTRAWSFFGKESQTDWINDSQSWRPLKYNLTSLESIVLSIRWSSPYLLYTQRAKFYLMPTSDLEYGVESQKYLTDCHINVNQGASTEAQLRHSISALHLLKKNSNFTAVPALEESPFQEEIQTSSTVSLGQAYQWYMHCRSSHSCHRLAKSPRWSPTRLLDIGSPDETSWKLRITSLDTPIPPLYMTLSYNWGSTSFVKLTSSNINEYRRGAPIKDLPQTFRDVIAVAWRFSIRFIWIDALCILQDSQEDWEKEAALMRDVYVNSSCNVAAAASTDPQGGLFRSRHASDIQYGLLWSNALDSTGQLYHILDEAYWNRQVSDAMLHKRGWVLQERLLSPRTLHFTEHQIFWECFVDQKCEAFPLGPPPFLSTKSCKPGFELSDSMSQGPANAKSTIMMWHDIVERYTRCTLTMPNDKMVALSGLARLYQQTTGDDYVAGLWRSHLLEGLNWYVVRPTTKPGSEYRAPSWSWAATDGPIDFNHSYSYLAQIFDVGIISSTIDPTGQVREGFIDLEAVVIPATYNREDSRYTGCHLKIGDNTILGVRAYKDHLNGSLEDDSEVYCLVLAFSHYSYILDSKVERHVQLEGLFLRAVPDISGSYTRIGYFEFVNEVSMRLFGVFVDPSTKEVTQDKMISPTRIRIL